MYMRKLWWRLLGLGFAISIAAAPATVGQESGANRVDKTSKYSFSQTIKKLESTLEAEHMMIVAKIDHKKMLAMVGAKIKGATTLEFGKPDMGKMLLPMNPAIGLEMPAKIYVYETADGKVVVSYKKAAADYSSYGSPEVANAGGMMDMMLEKVTGTVTQ